MSNFSKRDERSAEIAKTVAKNSTAPRWRKVCAICGARADIGIYTAFFCAKHVPPDVP